MNQDKVIFKFMANTPSPTYEFARFADWFGFYIDSCKGNQITDSDKERAKKLYSEYQENLILFESELVEIHSESMQINRLESH